MPRVTHSEGKSEIFGTALIPRGGGNGRNPDFRKPASGHVQNVVLPDRPRSCHYQCDTGGKNEYAGRSIKGWKMVDHETRRKIIRQWMSLPKDKRQTPDQAADFARNAVEQNKLHQSRRDPYERVVGWLLPRTGKSHASARRQG